MNTLEDRYTLIESAARTAHSEVFLARQNDSSDLVLIKQLVAREEGVAPSADRKLRFTREITTVTSLDHPNIAKPIDSMISGQTYTLVYPYLKGQTLSQILEKGPIGQAFALSIITQLLDALDYLHGRGIVHCDISPRNIFVAESGGAQLLDFSLSLTVDDAKRMTEFEEKGITPVMQGCGGDFSVRADEYLLDRVLQNLLANAGMYTPARGRVELTCVAPGRVEVFNSGEPIPEAFRESLFEKYARITTTSSRFSKGLGLFFCKLVMEAHGGAIGLACSDEGNRFVLNF